MITIINRGSLAHALSLPINPQIKQLLIDRRGQLGDDIVDLARFIVVQPGDSLGALETALGFSILQNQTDGSRFGDPESWPRRWIQAALRMEGKTGRCLRALP